MANIKITVATPAFGEMYYAPYVQSLLRLQAAAYHHKWSMHHATVSYAFVADARNYLLTSWYDKTDSTHLLFVDADMGFEPQLILDMVAFDKPVAGVIYTRRQIDLKKLVALAAKGETAERAIASAHDFILRPLRGRQPRQIKGFLEVEGCGTGIMLIKRAAIETMLKTLPGINDTKPKKTAPALAAGLNRLIRAFDVIEVDGVPLIDDYAFCYRWQGLCKGELWARFDRSVTHVGLHRFGGRYADAEAVVPRVTVSLGRSSAVGGKVSGKRNGNGGRVPPPVLAVTQPRKDKPAKN
jgi:hypothetical protein